jgi:hypothetical protein
MMMQAFSRAVALSAVLSFCTASAEAQVTKVTVLQEPVFAGVPVKVRVEGRNPCGAITIDQGFRSGKETKPLENGLPYETLLTWPNVGQFTMTVQGEGADCTGRPVSVVVNVHEFKALHPAVRITGYFGLAKPGAVAGIVGKGFGSTKGTVTATLKRFNGDTLVVDTFDILKENDGTDAWYPGLIGIRWPDISDVRAQSATIRVKVVDRTSNAWTVQFIPDLEFRSVPRADMKVVSCSMDANDNQCNGVTDLNPCAMPSEWSSIQPWPEFGSAISGWHANCLGAVGDDSGTDVYEIALINDWVLETFEFHRDVSGDDGDYVKLPTPAFPRGAATWKVSIKWLASSDDEVKYEGLVGIIGPKGVPHK